MSFLNIKIPVLKIRIGLLLSSLWLSSYLAGSLAKNSLCSNNELYNNKYQICCKGKVQNRLTGQQCCGGTKFYYEDTSLCCGNKVKDRYIVNVCPHNKVHCEKEELVQEKCSPNDVNCQEQMCCGEDSVSKDDTMCCFDNKIVLTPTQRKESDFLRCCNETSLFDIRTEVCCGKKKRSLETQKDIDCCGDIFYRHDFGNCLISMNDKGHLKYEVGNKNEGMCGDQKYNKNINGCCLGILNNVPEYNPEVPNLNEPNPNFGCCDSLVMNPVEEKCCRNHHYPDFDTHIIPNRQEIKCCGTGYYNTSEENCFGGQRIKIKKDELLCGGIYIDPDIKDCCLNEAYLKESEMCCKGILNITVIPKYLKCCNGVGISHDHLCCDGNRPLKKSHPDDDECCYSGRDPVATFSQLNDQRCINGAVIEGYKQGTEPCGPRSSYDVATEICCEGNVISKSKGDECCGSRSYNSDTHQCCSDQVINTQTQQCCFDVVFNIAPMDGSCCYIDGNVYKFGDSNNPCIKNCSGLLYDETFQVCCAGNIHNYQEEFVCCDRAYIDSSTKDCCAGHVYDVKPQRECCGGFYINRKKKTCCAASYPYSFKGAIQCCGDRDLYDTRWSQCNSSSSRVVSRFNDTQKLCLIKDLKNFDQIVDHGCKRLFGFRAFVQNTQIKRYPTSEPDIVELHLTRVQRLKNVKPLPDLRNNQTLVLKVSVNKNNKVKCRGRYFKERDIIVLLDQEAYGNTIKVMADSKLFISKYSIRTEKLIAAASQSC